MPVPARIVAALFITALAAAGCAGESAPGGARPAEAPAGSPPASAAATPTASASATPAQPPRSLLRRSPAAAAGGICRLLTFQRVERVLGVDFDVAAASGSRGASQTCVLREVDTATPDLVLTMTPVATMTARTFRESYVPGGATALDGIGQAAYRAVTRSGGVPRVEIGWLSGSRSVLTLAYTFAAEENPNVTGQVTERLIVLGKGVDARR